MSDARWYYPDGVCRWCRGGNGLPHTNGPHPCPVPEVERLTETVATINENIVMFADLRADR